MPDRGRLIALECVDDALLDAVTRRLYRHLRARGVACEHTAEPTYGPVGAQLLLARQGRLQFGPLSRALVDLADRLDHLGREDGIVAWLEAGRCVLCAHYLLSAWARLIDHVDLAWLCAINARCPAPDLTLLIEVPPAPENAALAENYARVGRQTGHKIAVIDGRGASIEQIFDLCRRRLDPLCQRSSKPA